MMMVMTVNSSGHVVVIFLFVLYFIWFHFYFFSFLLVKVIVIFKITTRLTKWVSEWMCKCVLVTVIDAQWWPLVIDESTNVSTFLSFYVLFVRVFICKYLCTLCYCTLKYGINGWMIYFLLNWFKVFIFSLLFSSFYLCN